MTTTLELMQKQIRELQRKVNELKALENAIIACRYGNYASPSIATSANTLVDYNIKAYDTWDCVTTGGSWRFTVPIGGIYSVKVLTRYESSTNFKDGNQCAVRVFKNGNNELNLGGFTFSANTASGVAPRFFAGGDVELAKDDYIDIRQYQTTGFSIALYGDNLWNWVAIAKLSS